MNKRSEKSRNDHGPYQNMVKNSLNYELDIHLETQKDKKLNLLATQSRQQAQFLTQDVEDIDNRIMALEVKIETFIKEDYERESKKYEGFTDQLEELREFESGLATQVELINEQFEMDIIGKFSDKEVVDSFKGIIYNSIGLK